MAALAQLVGRSQDGAAAVDSFLHVMPHGVAGPAAPRDRIGAGRAHRGRCCGWARLIGLWTVGSFIETIRDILRRAYGTVALSAAFWHLPAGIAVAIIVGRGRCSILHRLFGCRSLLTADRSNSSTASLPLAQASWHRWVGISRIVAVLW